MWKPGRISITRSSFTTRSSTVRWRCALAKTSQWQPCRPGLWLFGSLAIPRAALADVDHALKDGREIGQTATLMYALGLTLFTDIFCRNYAAANAEAKELLALADESGALAWKPFGMMHQGSLLPLTGQASDAAQTMISGISAWRSTGATMSLPWWLCDLARAYAGLGQFVDAWRCISEATTAVETTKERIWEAEVHRTAGEIALMSGEPEAARAEAYFERALAVSRKQQAKSWELRAAMSMARLWRDQGKPQQARELLAPTYGWFIEGFNTLDLKRAKALLDELT